MNAEIDYKKLANAGVRQRKYAGNISVVAEELAEVLIQHAIKVEDSQGVYWFYVDDSNAVAFEIRQSDNILSLALTQIGAPPQYWERKYYTLGKKLTKRIVDAVQAKMNEETAQAANDAAGEAAYNEVVAETEPRYVVGKRTNEYCWYVWDNEEGEEASKNIWDESEAQKRADEMNANDPVQLKKQNESLLEENHALHSEIQALKIQLAEKDKRIEELDTAIIRYRDYALNLQYALKRAGLSIEVDNVPAPVASEAGQDGEVLMTDATWPTLFSSEIDWLARNILLAKESHAFTFYNSTDAADLVGRVTHNLHTCIMLNSEYDTPANRAAIASRRKELGL